MGNAEIVEQWAQAVGGDWELLRRVCQPDYIEEWHQSDERINGLENFIAIHENYPGGTPQSERERVVGSEDKWVLTPSFTPLRIVGTGDTYTVVAMVTYPGGQQSHLVSIVDLKDGKVARAQTFFPDAFDAPAWRAQWIERMSAP